MARMKLDLRRWFPIAVLVLASISLTLIATWPEVQRQQRYLRSALTVLVVGALLLVSLLSNRRVPVRSRLGLLAGIAAVGVLLGGIFRIRGVNGDLLPILELRWKSRTLEGGTRQPVPDAQRPAQQAPNMGEFTQFYGPGRNAVLAEPILETNWSAHPPILLWKQAVGPGWSGFAVQDGLAVTLEQRGESEYVTCYEVVTGRPIWSHSDEARYASTIAGEGPRTTPTLSGDRVYTFGATGILNCLDRHTGKRFWFRDAARENEAKLPDWGFASSPLVVDGKVVISLGGASERSLVAYGAEDGAFAWGAGDGGADFSSPMEATLLGERMILIFNTRGIVAHALTGPVLWTYPWPGKHPHVSVPVVVGTNQVLVSSGYGTGIELIEVSRTGEGKAGRDWTATSVWKSMALKSKFGPILVKDDYIYGLDDGILVCVELKTGQRRWKDGRYGHGQALLVAGMILLTSERGEVILIEPSPEKLLENGRIQVLTGKTWNPPALAGEYLLMRNDQEAACLKLSTKVTKQKELAKNVPLLFAK